MPSEQNDSTGRLADLEADLADLEAELERIRARKAYLHGLAWAMAVAAVSGGVYVLLKLAELVRREKRQGHCTADHCAECRR